MAAALHCVTCCCRYRGAWRGVSGAIKPDFWINICFVSLIASLCLSLQSTILPSVHNSWPSLFSIFFWNRHLACIDIECYNYTVLSLPGSKNSSLEMKQQTSNHLTEMFISTDQDKITNSFSSKLE